MADSKTCQECGAVLPAGSERCPLCGTPVSEAEEESAEPPEEKATPKAGKGAEQENDDRAGQGVFCNQCGWENPSGANYCSRCGHELESVGDEASTPPGTKPAAGPSEKAETSASREAASAAFPSAADDGLARRVGVVVGIAVLLVAGLYGWSVWSEGQEQETAAAGGEAAPMMGGGATGAPGGRGARGGSSGASSGGLPEVIRQQQGGDVPASIAPQVDSLQEVIDTRSGQAQQRARRKLARLFDGAGLTGRAAAQQWRLARQDGSPVTWERAGSLLYDWMASLSRNEPKQAQQRAQVARLTVDAYQRVLKNDPDNHDVRTNLAVAYLDTNTPMRGISEIKRVLNEKPDHVGARFNYGLMQVMIGRNATAIEQFERVRETASEDSPYYQQAGQIIERIKEKTGGNPQDAPMPGQGGSASATDS